MEATTASPQPPGRSAALEFSRPRAVALAAACALVILAVTGVINAALFRQPDTIKYIVTVTGSIFVALLVTVQAPLRVIVGVAILVAPFDFVVTFVNIQVTPLLAVDVLAVLVWLPRARTPGLAALRPMVVLFPLLLLPALLRSNGVAVWSLWLAVTVVTGCMAFVVAREPGGPAFIATMLALSALVQAALAIWEHRTGHRLNLYGTSGRASYGSEYYFTLGSYDRPPGAAPDPIGLGQILALCIPMTVALAVSIRRWPGVIVALGVAGVSVIALLLSLSRMSTVGAAVGLVVVVLLLPERVILSRGPAIAAMVALVAVVGLALGGRTLTQRLESILNPTASHVSTAPGDLSRQRIWQAAIRTAEANFVTGVGFGNVPSQLPKHGVPLAPNGHAHNTYLQFFDEGGLLGLVAILGTLAAACRDLVRGFSRHRIWVAGAAGSLIATMLAWLTDVEVRYVQVSGMVAVLLGLIAALGLRESRSPPEERLASAGVPTPVDGSGNRQRPALAYSGTMAAAPASGRPYE
jgi:O-Antigen ligase